MQPRFEELFASPQHYEKYKARLGKKLAEFRFGFMSDAKWRKLFAAICAECSPVRHCEIYDFFGSCVNEIRFAVPAEGYRKASAKTTSRSASRRAKSPPSTPR